MTNDRLLSAEIPYLCHLSSVIRSEPKRVSEWGLKRLPQLHVGFVQPSDSLFIEVAGFI